jgi:hypothetical protein
MISITPLVDVSSTIRYWKKHIPDDNGAWTFDIELDEPAVGGEAVELTFGGDAVLTTDYTLSESGTITFSAGDTSKTITVTPVPKSEYFLEKKITITLSAVTNAKLHHHRYKAELWIRSATLPPVIEYRTAGQTRPVGAFLVRFYLNTVSGDDTSEEDVVLYYTYTSTISEEDLTLDPSGTITISAGSTFGDVYGSATSAGEITFSLLDSYEGNSVNYTETLIVTGDEEAQTQDIHEDENMCTWSDTQGLEPRLREAIMGTVIPGNPTNWIVDGTSVKEEVEEEGRKAMYFIDQSDPNPVLNPITSEPLKIFALSDYSDTSMGYLRQGFADQFCAGASAGASTREWTRGSFYVKFPLGLDSWREYEYVGISYRNRKENIDHTVSFKTGFDLDTYLHEDSTGRRWQLWGEKNMHPVDGYGIVDDENGVRIWYTHFMDETETSYLNSDINPVQKFDHVGDTGLFIFWPCFGSAIGNSQSALQVSGGLEASRGKGIMPYGFMWEMSVTAIGQDLKPYWPKPRNFWEPKGLAVVNRTPGAGQYNTHLVTLTQS